MKKLTISTNEYCYSSIKSSSPENKHEIELSTMSDDEEIDSP